MPEFYMIFHICPKNFLEQLPPFYAYGSELHTKFNDLGTCAFQISGINGIINQYLPLSTLSDELTAWWVIVLNLYWKDTI